MRSVIVKALKRGNGNFTRFVREEIQILAHDELMKDISQLLKSGELSPFFKDFDGGPCVQRFEKEFAQYVGVRYAVSMANGTLALNAAYTATQLPGGSEFITTPWTFVATVGEIIRAGYTPVFADVDLETGTLDGQSVASKVTPRTACVVPMHPLGVPCDMDKLLELRKEHGLRVCEDSCQALGSTFQGRMCGTVGDMGCFSLQQTKSLSSGEGGVVVTNDESLYDSLRHIRNHGNKYGEFRERFTGIVASNYRLTEIQAAIALHALRNYPDILKDQLERFHILFDSLAVSRVLVPQAQYAKSSRNGYIIGSRLRTTIRNPEATRQQLLRRMGGFSRGLPGYVVGPGYSEVVYDLPAFRRLKLTEHPCPNAEELVKRSVWFDVRKMPMETVKELGRRIEKFRL
jgi:perosamine synthetase